MSNTNLARKAERLWSFPDQAEGKQPHQVVVDSINRFAMRRASQGQTYDRLAIARFCLGDVDIVVEHARQGLTFARQRYSGRIGIILANEWSASYLEYQLLTPDADTPSIYSRRETIFLGDLETGLPEPEEEAIIGVPINGQVFQDEANLLESLLTLEVSPAAHCYF